MSHEKLCDFCSRLVNELIQRHSQGTLEDTSELVLEEKDSLGLWNCATPLRNFVDVAEPSSWKARESKSQPDCLVCASMVTVEWELPKSTDPFRIRIWAPSLPKTFAFTLSTEKYTWRFNEPKITLAPANNGIHDLAQAAISSRSTGSKETLDLALHWLSDCLQNHTKCNARLSPVRYPRRLLDVSYTDPRLIETAEHLPDGPYATISHCWGTDKFLVLTKASLKRFMAGTELSALPRSFQDAIAVVKYLGLRYLWIDCYCIVQDLKSDIEVEISRMKDVYANGILNIGAAQASGPGDGCFCDRAPFQFSCYFYSDDKFNGYETWLLHDSDIVYQHRNLLGREPLFQRAWMLQERFTTPKMLHFTSYGIQWECQQISNCSEAFPTKMDPVIGISLSHYEETDNGYCPVFSIDGADIVERSSTVWMEAVEAYSRMRLSFPSKDKLLAIGGMAQQITERSGDEYIAGFLRTHLLSHLSWQLDASSKRVLTEWRAPSWSWASTDHSVYFAKRYSYQFYAVVELCSIQKADVELQDPSNFYGAIKSGSLVLTGRLLRATGKCSVARRRLILYDRADCQKVSVNVSIDDESFGPITVPGSKAKEVIEPRTADTDLYLLLLEVSYDSQYQERVVPIESSLDRALRLVELVNGNGRKVPRKSLWGSICGLLLEKISNGSFVRRGCSHEYLYTAEILDLWTKQPEETITLY